MREAGAAATFMAGPAPGKIVSTSTQRASAIQHIELVRGSIGEIDEAIRKKRPAIVDAHHYRFAIAILVTRT